MPREVRAAYAERVQAILAAGAKLDESVELALTTGARSRLDIFRGQLEPMLTPEIETLSEIADWASKLPGALVRIAALLTLFDDPTATTIGDLAMSTAVHLANYLTAEALYGMPPARRPQQTHARIATFTPTAARLAVDAWLALNRGAMPTADEHAGFTALLRYARWGDFVEPVPVSRDDAEVPAEWISAGQDTASLVGVSDRAVQLAISEGRIRAATFGGKRYVRRSDALAWRDEPAKRAGKAA